MRHSPAFTSARKAARWLIREHRRGGHRGPLLIDLYQDGQFIGTLRYH